MNKKFIVILMLFIILLLFILLKNKDISEKFSNNTYCSNTQLVLNDPEERIIKIRNLIKIGENQKKYITDKVMQKTIEDEISNLEKKLNSLTDIENQCNFYGNRLVNEKYCRFKHIGICRHEMQTIKKKKYDINNSIYTFFTEENYKHGIRLKIDGEKEDFEKKNGILEKIIDITYKKQNRDGSLTIYTDLNKKGIFINANNAKYFDKVTSIYIILPNSKKMHKINKSYESVSQLLSKKDKYKNTKTTLCYPVNNGGTSVMNRQNGTECSLIKENPKTSGIVKVNNSNLVLSKNNIDRECISSYVDKNNHYIKNSDYTRTFNKVGCPNMNKLPIYRWRGKDKKKVIDDMYNICERVKKSRARLWEKDVCCDNGRNCKPLECKILPDILENNNDIPKKLICTTDKPSCIGHKIKDGRHIYGKCYNIKKSACTQLEFHKNILSIGFLYIIPYKNNIWWLPSVKNESGESIPSPNVCNNMFAVPWRNKFKVDQTYFNHNNVPKVGKEIQCEKLQTLLDDCKLFFSENKNTGQIFIREDIGGLRKSCKIKINDNNSNCNTFGNNWFEPEGSSDTGLDNCQKKHVEYIKRCNTQNIDMEHIECNGKKTNIYGKGNILYVNRKLNIGEYLISENRKFKLVFEENGNLCLYTNYPQLKMLWCLRDESNSNIRINFREIMRNTFSKLNKNNLQFKFKSNSDLGIISKDTDIMLFSFAKFYWEEDIKYINRSRNKEKINHSRLILTDDGNITIFNNNNRIVWKLYDWFDPEIKRVRHHPIVDYALTYYKSCYLLEDNTEGGVWEKDGNMHNNSKWIWYLPNAQHGTQEYHNEDMVYAYLSSKEINARMHLAIDDLANVYVNDKNVGNVRGTSIGANILYFKLYKGFNKIIVNGTNWKHRAGVILSVYDNLNSEHLFSSNTDWKFKDGSVPPPYYLNWTTSTGYTKEIAIKRGKSYLKKW